MLDLLRCWSVRVEYPGFMGSHQRHKGVFVAHERGHLSLPLANKRSHSPPFLWFCLARGPRTKVQKTWIIHREMNKGLICIDFAPPQKESFFGQKNERAKHFFGQQKIEQWDQQHLLMWRSRREISKSSLCHFVRLKDFPLGLPAKIDCDFCVEFTLFGHKLRKHQSKFE